MTSLDNTFYGTTQELRSSHANSNRAPDIAVIVEDSDASRRVLEPKEWMKETWESMYGKRRLSFAVAQSVSFVIQKCTYSFCLLKF